MGDALIVRRGGGGAHGAYITATIDNSTLTCAVELYLGDILVARKNWVNGVCVFTGIQTSGTYTVSTTINENTFANNVLVTAENIVNKEVVTVALATRVYLYNEGDERNVLTGGWFACTSCGTAGWTNTVPTKQSNYLYLNPASGGTGTTLYCSEFDTNNRIDLTTYGKLCAQFEYVAGSGVATMDGGRLFATTTKSQGWDGPFLAYTGFPYITPNSGVLEVDISAVTQSAYIGCLGIRASRIKLYKIWLE